MYVAMTLLNLNNRSLWGDQSQHDKARFFYFFFDQCRFLSFRCSAMKQAIQLHLSLPKPSGGADFYMCFIQIIIFIPFPLNYGIWRAWNSVCFLLCVCVMSQNINLESIFSCSVWKLRSLDDSFAFIMSCSVWKDLNSHFWKILWNIW